MAKKTNEETMVQSVEKLNLRDGDILVAKIRPPKFCYMVQQSTRAALRKILDDSGKSNQIIVVSANDVEFSVMPGNES